MFVAVLAAGFAGCDSATPDSRDPADLIELAGDGQFALPNTPVPESLVVRVVDANDQGVSGVAVSWTPTTGGGTVLPAATSSDATGRLAARWVLGNLGPNAVNASAAGFTVTFTATATTNVATQLGIATQPAGAKSGVVFSAQPVVELRDNTGTPVAQAGVTVTVSKATGSGFGSLTGTLTAVTGTNGRATFSNLGILGPVGNYTLQFTATGYAPVTSGGIDLGSESGMIPLTDMGARTYFGFEGGLFASGSNTMPAAHAAAGAARARAIERLDINGNPSGSGKIVLLSVGMSNTTQEWCSVTGTACDAWTFSGQAAADPAVNHTSLVIANGAGGGQTAPFWVSPSDPNYDRVRDNVLTPLGLSEAQVQVIWFKAVNAGPHTSLPAANADAVDLLGEYGNILRSLHARYPNLKMVFMSSRIYAGYATTPQNPEPFAYESGFAVKWAIQAQIDQMANGGTVVDARAGNLNYNSAAPWIGWGPYFWADGLNPRADGITWLVSDMEGDGTHPGTPAETKVGAALLSFFKTNTHTSCWFLASGSCP